MYYVACNACYWTAQTRIVCGHNKFSKIFRVGCLLYYELFVSLFPETNDSITNNP
jgi:hypothetical protein